MFLLGLGPKPGLFLHEQLDVLVEDLVEFQGVIISDDGDSAAVWLSKVMQYHIQPAAKRVDIAKHIGWHTFRHTYTTLLHANGEDVKVVQELLRRGSAKITMDVYAQALTPAKRKAQEKVVAMAAGHEERGDVRLKSCASPVKIGVSNKSF